MLRDASKVSQIVFHLAQLPGQHLGRCSRISKWCLPIWSEKANAKSGVSNRQRHAARLRRTRRILGLPYRAPQNARRQHAVVED